MMDLMVNMIEESSISKPNENRFSGIEQNQAHHSCPVARCQPGTSCSTWFTTSELGPTTRYDRRPELGAFAIVHGNPCVTVNPR
jgi:hypothetical protein